MSWKREPSFPTSKGEMFYCFVRIYFIIKQTKHQTELFFSVYFILFFFFAENRIDTVKDRTLLKRQHHADG